MHIKRLLRHDKANHVVMTGLACCLHSSTVIKYFIPSFGGQSYLAFQTMSAYHTVRIAMEFRASEMTGILLYNGQDGKKDFISLSLVNGKVELRWALWELRASATSSAADSAYLVWLNLMKLKWFSWGQGHCSGRWEMLYIRIKQIESTEDNEANNYSK